MRQRARGLGLAQEATGVLGILTVLGLQDLDGERPVYAGIVGAIHVGHGALADPLLDAVASDQFKQSASPPTRKRSTS